MTSKKNRSLAIAALALTAGALGAGTASAAPTTPAATPVAGSVEVCLPIPAGPIELSLCL
ncbi:MULTISPECIES: hypothetical protein [Nocardia]|uniref:Uncharacterized protein n=1 Tax=Nocardia sputorum TaxID=2984338 RepID=A0ABN6U2F2_9NOCA|nr:hypothetical protein [Nocardia sputorum]BDT99323.1 hypothetical protein IFM12276_23520 [Nocardia sputorum]